MTMDAELKERVLDAIRKVMNNTCTNEENVELMNFIEQSVVDPSISDYIFWDFADNITPESILDRALAYQPIQLPDRSK